MKFETFIEKSEKIEITAFTHTAHKRQVQHCLQFLVPVSDWLNTLQNRYSGSAWRCFTLRADATDYHIPTKLQDKIITE